MKKAHPKDESIKEALCLLSNELLRRYGRSADCTQGQMSTAVADLKIAQDVLPYVYAVFLSEEAFLQVRHQSPATVWEEVENRSGRLLRELPSSRWSTGHFHESGVGDIGDGSH